MEASDLARGQNSFLASIANTEDFIDSFFCSRSSRLTATGFGHEIVGENNTSVWGQIGLVRERW
jgi:hypothetical protein